MKSKIKDQRWIILALGLFSAGSMAVDPSIAGDTCVGYGPQTPRDIDKTAGENKRIFSLAPSYKQMNLCNIHFHVKGTSKNQQIHHS